MINKKINKAQYFILKQLQEAENSILSRNELHKKFYYQYPNLPVDAFNDFFEDLLHNSLVRIVSNCNTYYVSKTDNSPLFFLPISTITIIEEYEMLIESNLLLPRTANKISIIALVFSALAIAGVIADLILRLVFKL